MVEETGGDGRVGGVFENGEMFGRVVKDFEVEAAFVVVETKNLEFLLFKVEVGEAILFAKTVYAVNGR